MTLEWILGESKFLTKKETRKLRQTINEGRNSNSKNIVRDSFIINLAMSTGLRVQEIVDLKVEDLFIEEEQSSLFVRRGKCGKQRIVYFSEDLKQQIFEYLEFKKQIEEPLEKGSPLIYSRISKSQVTKRSLQNMFKRYAKLAGISERHSIHHLRHTYAVHLYKSSNYDLRLIQKQLGHSQIKTTAVYADMCKGDTNKALQNLYK